MRISATNILFAAIILVIAASYIFLGDSGRSPKANTPPVDPKTPPQIIKLEPENGATGVDPSLQEIRVTFNMEMGEGFSWCGSGDHYPALQEGKRPSWKEDKKTCVLPVKLKAGWTYKLGINCPAANNFRSAMGTPAPVTWYSFTTK